jgi:hypothetical protein
LIGSVLGALITLLVAGRLLPRSAHV